MALGSGCSSSSNAASLAWIVSRRLLLASASTAFWGLMRKLRMSAPNMVDVEAVVEVWVGSVLACERWWLALTPALCACCSVRWVAEQAN